MSGSEHLTREHGPAYKRFAKRKWRRYVRRMVKEDPEEAPRKLRSKGWV